MIGNRLKLARDAAGLSLRQLQDRMGDMVSAQAIGKYERDEMMPSSAVLLSIAKALDVSAEFLMSKRELALVDIDFRKGPAAAVKEERAVEAIVLDQAERYLELESLLPGVSIDWKAPAAKEFSIEKIEDAEGAAEKLRQLWKLGIDPIPSMTELLEEKGIKVISIQLPDLVSGSKAFANQEDRKAAALIVVNSIHNGERQRFTLAHELGHLVLRFNKSLSHIEQEKAADRFAGAFLVAQEMLRKLLGKSRNVVAMGELLYLKGIFKVSIAMLAVRCRQLGILTQGAYNSLWRTLKSSGLVDTGAAEPQPIPHEVPSRMRRLCLRAIAEEVISESKAAELLRISRRDLDSLLSFHGV